MSYEPDWNEPGFYAEEEGEVCEVCTESPCLCERYKQQEEKERASK